MGEVRVPSSGKQNNRSNSKKEVDVSCWNCFTTEDSKDNDLEPVTLSKVREEHREKLRLYPFIVNELSKPKTVPLKQKVSEQYVVTKRTDENLRKNDDAVEKESKTVSNRKVALNKTDFDEKSNLSNEVSLDNESGPGPSNPNNVDHIILLPNKNVPLCVTSTQFEQIAPLHKFNECTNEFNLNEKPSITSMKSHDVLNKEIVQSTNGSNWEGVKTQAGTELQDIEKTVKFQKNDNAHSSIITKKSLNLVTIETGNQKETGKPLVQIKYDSIANDGTNKIGPNVTASSRLEIYAPKSDAMLKLNTDTEIPILEKSCDEESKYEFTGNTLAKNSDQNYKASDQENLTRVSNVKENDSADNKYSPIFKNKVGLLKKSVFLEEENKSNTTSTVKDKSYKYPSEKTYSVPQRSTPGIPVNKSKIPRASPILTRQKTVNENQVDKTNVDPKNHLIQRLYSSDKTTKLLDPSKSVSTSKSVKPILKSLTSMPTTATTKFGKTPIQGLNISDKPSPDKTKSNILDHQPVLLKQKRNDINATRDTLPNIKSSTSSKTNESPVKGNSIPISKNTDESKVTLENYKQGDQILIRNSKTISSASRKETVQSKEGDNAGSIGSESRYGAVLEDLLEKNITKSTDMNFENNKESTEEISSVAEITEFLEQNTNSVASLPSLSKTTEKTILKTSSLASGINNAGWKSPIKSLRWSTLSIQPRSFSVEGHPNIKAFIMQGGLQSTDEAITAGVPLICFPLFSDQWYNAEKYVKFKIGIKLDFTSFTKSQLTDAIKTVIFDKSYRENIIRIREQMYDEPQTPLERAIWWVEYVIRHGGARHLRAPSANVSWTEYYEFELFILTATVILLLITLILLSFAVMFIKHFNSRFLDRYNKIKKS